MSDISSSSGADVDSGRGRYLPPPRSISPEAQALVASPRVDFTYPDIDDLAGWTAHVAKMNVAFQPLLDAMPYAPETGATRKTFAGVSVVWATPAERRFAKGKVILDIHGGSLIYFGGSAVEHFARRAATILGADVVSVDYRMPPHHPYPAGLQDCLTVYKQLVAERGSKNVIVYGYSAGGNLAAALMLLARDEGVNLPEALVLLSPEVDLTESGDTFQTLLDLDKLRSLMAVNKLYAGDFPLDHPYVSPLFGEFSQGFPPTFLQSGTRDLFLSNTVRMHRALRKAGIAADLHIWEAMPHGSLLGTVEGDEVAEEVVKFISTHWN